MTWVVAYIVLIVTVNWGFSVVPLVPLPTGEMWPPMSLAVGLIFVVRDFAQRQVGHWVWLAMLAGGALSYVMASPVIAVASVTAFMASEAADWGLYTYTKRPFHDRILVSSLVSTPLDSVVFLWLIGHLSVSGVVAMTLSKLLGALVIYALLRRAASSA